MKKLRVEQTFQTLFSFLNFLYQHRTLFKERVKCVVTAGKFIHPNIRKHLRALSEER